MRIALITRCLVDGGTERVAARLSVLWSQFGHEVVLLTGQTAKENEFPHECIGRECSQSGMWTPKELAAFHEKYGFDVCIFNGDWNEDGFALLVNACRTMNVATIVILHHAFDNWAFSLCNSGDFYKDDILTLVDCIVCVDKMQALWWDHRCGKVVHIPNPCVRREDLMQSNVRAGLRSKRIVWVGRPKDRGKRIELAMAAFAKIAAVEPDAKLTIVGAMRDGQEAELRRMVSPDVWERVLLAGYLPDVTGVMGESSVNLVTTQWEVTVPQVILEAMQAGIPTVAFDLPVLRQLGCEAGVALAKGLDEMAAKTAALLTRQDSRDALMQGATAFIDGQQERCEAGWKNLLSAVGEGRVAELVETGRREFHDLGTYGILVDEVQRGEMAFVGEHFPQLMKWLALKRRARQLMGFIGLK